MLKRITTLPFIKNISYNAGGFSTFRRPILESYENEISEEVEKARQPDMPVDMKDPFEKDKPRCILCKYDVKLNYKNVRLLSQFVSPFSGKVYERNITGLCERQQRNVLKAIQRARAAGLMPYYHKIPMFIKDPPLFDPEKPIKPHNY